MVKKQASKSSPKKKGAAKTAKKSGPPVRSKGYRPVKKEVLTDEDKEANLLVRLDKQKTAGSKRPKKKVTAGQTRDLLESVIEGMKERKARNITVLDLHAIENRVSDFFVICDADSNTHVNSIADAVEETVEKLSGEKAYHLEGRQNGEWILIDYINIVAHVFLRDSREHYNLEGLWGDAEISTITS